MTDLITQWGALEPERCRVYDSPEGVPHVDFIEIDWLAMELGAHEDLVMVTQHAVQKAIEARRWTCTIKQANGTGKHTGTIQDLTDLRKPHLQAYSARSEDNPAHALLSAYMKALEAQP